MFGSDTCRITNEACDVTKTSFNGFGSQKYVWDHYCNVCMKASCHYLLVVHWRSVDVNHNHRDFPWNYVNMEVEG